MEKCTKCECIYGTFNLCHWKFNLLASNSVAFVSFGPVGLLVLF